MVIDVPADSISCDDSRVALEQAGVPDYTIWLGAFNDPRFAHDGSVEVLLLCLTNHGG